MTAWTDLPVTWIAIRASGITAWALLTVVVGYGLLMRTRLLGQAAPPQRLLVVHRVLATTAVLILTVHLGCLLIDPAVTFTVADLFIPFLAPWKPVQVALGILALWALVPVVVILPLRARMGKAGAVLFRRSHLLAYAAWPLATLHYVFAGTDALTWWSLAALMAAMAAVTFMLLTRGFVPRPVRARSPRPVVAAAAPASGPTRPPQAS